MLKLVFALLGVLTAFTAAAQGNLPVDLEDCTGPGANFCFDTVGTTIENDCGVLFENYQGRIAWPALRNAGPITIAVQTRNTAFDGQTWFPLYVEIATRSPSDVQCETGRPGVLVLSTNSGVSCGGSWTSVGPIDLTVYHIPLGAPYSVLCTFFRSTPGGITHRTVGFSCIRVTSTRSGVVPISWARTKEMYR